MFEFIINFFKIQSNRCETKTVLVLLPKLLLVAAKFCIYRAHTEKNVGRHSEIKALGPWEKEYKKYCLNGGEFSCLNDEGNVGCICTWLYGAKPCEQNRWRD